MSVATSLRQGYKMVAGALAWTQRMCRTGWSRWLWPRRGQSRSPGRCRRIQAYPPNKQRWWISRTQTLGLDRNIGIAYRLYRLNISIKKIGIAQNIGIFTNYWDKYRYWWLIQIYRCVTGKNIGQEQWKCIGLTLPETMLTSSPGFSLCSSKQKHCILLK